MKNQYFGDFNDYIKYSLIRNLSGEGDLRTSICWLLTYDEETTDGNKRKYLEQSNMWRAYDPVVFDFLSMTLEKRIKRNTQLVEKSSLLPNIEFFNDLIEDDAEKRELFFQRFSQLSHASDLIFFDPDNGLEIKSVQKGKRNSSKYVFWDEVRTFYEKGHSIMIYQHFPRQKRNKYIENVIEKADQILSPGNIITYSTPYVLFLLLIQLKHDNKLMINSKKIARSWEKVIKITSRAEFNQDF